MWITKRVRTLALICAGLACVAAGPGSPPAAGVAPPAEEDEGLLHRIDFGNAYVMGQSIQSGAVYLLNRKKTDIRSMLREREDFREEIREDAEVVDPTRE
jgi:hypothetical protein